MNRRVLIVDDNCAIHDDFRKILCEVESDLELGDAEALLFGEADEEVKVPDFELAFADQGKTARDMVADSVATGKPYALAFVDMRMPPGWDGV